MPLTSVGFTPRQYTEILEDMRSTLETALGTPISSDPDTEIGILLATYAFQVAEQEDLNQAQYTQLDRDKAEGTFLDRLVAYLGIERLGASPSSGQLKVWRNSVGQIFSSFLFSTSADVQYSAVNGLNHTLSECSEVTLTPSSNLDNTTYTVIINSNNYEYTTGIGESKADIVEGMATVLQSGTSLDITTEGDRLTISDSDDNQNSLNILYSRFSLVEIASFNFVESVLEGTLVTEVNTITEVVTGNSSILRSNNPLAFTDGRDIETDTELRERAEDSTQVSGVATLPAITATLRNLANVLSAAVIENRTLVTDSDGRPAKSYECIVEGGNPNDIAETIWNTKPAGAETYGNISTIITDIYDNQQSVNWSRPNPVYTHVEITFTKYDEEVFPSDGESTMADTILISGNDLGLGVDVIPSRFVGELHRSVQGIDSITVRVGTSNNPTDTSPDSWQTTSIAINNSEFADFALSRITVIDAT